MTQPNKCTICLEEEPAPRPYKFSCGCSVKVHKSCMDEWFKKPNAGCLYCRKEAKVVEGNMMENPVEPVYHTVINIQINPPVPTAETPIQQRDRIILKILGVFVCVILTFAIVIATVIKLTA